MRSCENPGRTAPAFQRWYGCGNLLAAAESKGKSSPGQRRFLRDRPWLEADAGPGYSGPGVSLCRHKGWGVVMGLKKLAGSHVALSPEELFPRDPSVSFLSSFGIFFLHVNFFHT